MGHAGNRHEKRRVELVEQAAAPAVTAQ